MKILFLKVKTRRKKSKQYHLFHTSEHEPLHPVIRTRGRREGATFFQFIYTEDLKQRPIPVSSHSTIISEVFGGRDNINLHQIYQ